jgi:hypothetical protein
MAPALALGTIGPLRIAFTAQPRCDAVGPVVVLRAPPYHPRIRTASAAQRGRYYGGATTALFTKS